MGLTNSETTTRKQQQKTTTTITIIITIIIIIVRVNLAHAKKKVFVDWVWPTLKLTLYKCRVCIPCTSINMCALNTRYVYLSYF